MRRVDPVDGEWRIVSPVPGPADGPCSLCGVLEVEPAAIAVVEAPDAELLVYGRHEESLADLSPGRIEAVVHVWADRYAELGLRRDVQYVLISETHRAQEHAHGRIDAYPDLPPRVHRQLLRGAERLLERGQCIGCDQVDVERADAARIVEQNESFIAFVPFAPRFPLELHLAAKRHAPSLLDLTEPERAALAEMLCSSLTSLRFAAGEPFGYALALLQAPTDDGRWQSVSHFRMEVIALGRQQSPVLGARELVTDVFEIGGTPEVTAARLRAAARNT